MELVGTKFLNTKSCPVELSSRGIPPVCIFWPKKSSSFDVALLSHQRLTVPASPKPFWKTPGMCRESYSTAKTLPVSHTKKIYLMNSHLPLACSHFIQASFVAVAIAVVSLF